LGVSGQRLKYYLGGEIWKRNHGCRNFFAWVSREPPRQILQRKKNVELQHSPELDWFRLGENWMCLLEWFCLGEEWLA